MGGSFHHHPLTLTQSRRAQAQGSSRRATNAHIHTIPHTSHVNGLLGLNRTPQGHTYGQTFVHLLILQIFNKMYCVPGTELGLESHTRMPLCILMGSVPLHSHLETISVTHHDHTLKGWKCRPWSQAAAWL